MATPGDTEEARQNLRDTLTSYYNRVVRANRRYKTAIDSDAIDDTDYSRLEEDREQMKAISSQYEHVFTILAVKTTDASKKKTDEDNLDTFEGEVSSTRRRIKQILTFKDIERTIAKLEYATSNLNTAWDKEPGKDHSVLSADITAYKDELNRLLVAIPMTGTERYRVPAGKAYHAANLILAKIKIPIDTKPYHSDSLTGGFKRPTVNTPKFSGELKDWESFWNAFKISVHNDTTLSQVAKLNHLREAMKDKDLYRRLFRMKKQWPS